MGSEQQQFCLRWNNHQSTLISVFDTLLENETLVDVTLAAEGQYLRAHKVVLSACSQYFQELLSQHIEKHPIVILKDVSFEELKALIDYMYRGEVNVSQEQLSALIKTAESLKIKGLADGGEKKDKKTAQQPPPPAPPPAPTIPPPTIQTLPILPLPPPPPPPAPSQQPTPPSSSLVAEMTGKDSLSSVPSPISVVGSREGSTSPVPRKRKKHRRRSGENAEQESDVSISLPETSPMLPNIPATVTPVNAIASSSTTTATVTHSERHSERRSSTPADSRVPSESAEDSKDVPEEMPDKKERHLLLGMPLVEPKHEYMNDEDSIGPLTLEEEEELSEMERNRDLELEIRPGPSHGGGDGTSGGQSSGFPPWHATPEGSGDEVFMTAQEAGQRQGQDVTFEESAVRPVEAWSAHGRYGAVNENMTCISGGFELDSITRIHQDITWNQFHCFNCGRSYNHQHNLKRHQELECGKEPQFQCPMCPKRCKQKSNLLRHVSLIHRNKPMPIVK